MTSVSITNDEIMSISSSEAGRELAAARKVKEKHCLVCGKQFTTIGRGKYCSEACKQRAKVQCKRAGETTSSSGVIQ
jgi:predicted nucleic acid-binding Zn ribbon protein